MPLRTTRHPVLPVVVNPRRLHRTVLLMPVYRIHLVRNGPVRRPHPRAATVHLPAAMTAAACPAVMPLAVIHPAVTRPVVIRPVVIRPVVIRPVVIRPAAPGTVTPRPAGVVIQARFTRPRHRHRLAVQVPMRRRKGRAATPRPARPMALMDRAAVRLTAAIRGVMTTARRLAMQAARGVARLMERCPPEQQVMFWTRSRAR